MPHRVVKEEQRFVTHDGQLKNETDKIAPLWSLWKTQLTEDRGDDKNMKDGIRTGKINVEMGKKIKDRERTGKVRMKKTRQD